MFQLPTCAHCVNKPTHCKPVHNEITNQVLIQYHVHDILVVLQENYTAQPKPVQHNFSSKSFITKLLHLPSTRTTV